MSLELASIPIALFAGIVSVLSPCVWPLVPVVMSSAATTGRAGPAYLAAGLSVSFAAAGTGLTFVLVSTGLDPELFRYVAAGLLVLVGLLLVIPRYGDRLTAFLSSYTNRWSAPSSGGDVNAVGQFGVGALLGLVWLPCVGPTLGAAIALASLGQNMAIAFVVMLAYGIGTAVVLLGAGVLSQKLLARWRPQLMEKTKRAKQLLGATLLVLGFLVFTGVDKILESWAVDLLPSWIFNL